MLSSTSIYSLCLSRNFVLQVALTERLGVNRAVKSSSSPEHEYLNHVRSDVFSSKMKQRNVIFK